MPTKREIEFNFMGLKLTDVVQDLNAELEALVLEPASGNGAESRSHSRFERAKLSPIFPQRFRSQSRVHVSVTRIFLEGARSLPPSNGVSSFVGYFALRSV